MKLSEQLAYELQKQLALNNALMATLMQNVAPPVIEKPKMDEKKKAELLARLAEGRRKAQEKKKGKNG